MGLACLLTLEDFLSTPKDGFKFTTTINIEILRKPGELADLIPQDDEEEQENQSTPIHRCFGLPSQVISDALNTLVRLVILQLPKNRLTTFL